MSLDHISPGVNSNSHTKIPYTSLSSNRASPLPPTITTSAMNSTMATTGFISQTQPFRSSVSSAQPPYPLSIGSIHPFDRDAPAKPIGTPYATTPSPASHTFIRRLPIDTTEEKLRLMLIFSQDLVDIEMVPAELSEEPGFASAIVGFRSPAGAQQAKEVLHGKSVGAGEILVDIFNASPSTSRRYPIDTTVSANSSGPSSTTSSGQPSRQASWFPGSFQPIEQVSPPMNSIYGSNELSNPDSSAHYKSLFSPQAPIGNHLTDRTRMSGKTLISHDSPEDDETRELLKDPVAYAENGHTQQRRATAPHLPISRLNGLSLNTGASVSASMPPFAHSSMTPLSAHGNTMSPTMMNGSNHSINYHISGQHYPQRHNFPPVNPADQNPPCNTLYVGNLPIDTSEEELKAMFSKQRGYKRLCFRTKQNGPMCFVEFEDVSFATKALHDLYGHPLHNSVKGGIRLSFSKNPLGVRSGQASGQTGTGSLANLASMMPGSVNGFTTASGPPPGLSAPPGLNRGIYNNSSPTPNGAGTPYSSSSSYQSGNSHVWNTPTYSGPLSAGGASASVNGSTSSFPPYMMGR